MLSDLSKCWQVLPAACHPGRCSVMGMSCGLSLRVIKPKDGLHPGSQEKECLGWILTSRPKTLDQLWFSAKIIPSWLVRHTFLALRPLCICCRLRRFQ